LGNKRKQPTSAHDLWSFVLFLFPAGSADQSVSPDVHQFCKNRTKMVTVSSHHGHFSDLELSECCPLQVRPWLGFSFGFDLCFLFRLKEDLMHMKGKHLSRT